MQPVFFPTPAEFRTWLEERHHVAAEVWVGFYKKGSGRPSITWPEAVDQALCFGWIDGVRKGVDEFSYAIRFTPRKRRSTWSAVNIRRVEELAQLGLMHPAGLARFAERAPERSAIYAYEQGDRAVFDDEMEKRFRENAIAWEFFSAQPPWYRRTATWWVVSAKREETRQKRLTTLIEDSQHGRTIRSLTRRPQSQ